MEKLSDVVMFQNHLSKPVSRFAQTEGNWIEWRLLALGQVAA